MYNKICSTDLIYNHLEFSILKCKSYFKKRTVRNQRKLYMKKSYFIISCFINILVSISCGKLSMLNEQNQKSSAYIS